MKEKKKWVARNGGQNFSQHVVTVARSTSNRRVDVLLPCPKVKVEGCRCLLSREIRQCRLSTSRCLLMFALASLDLGDVRAASGSHGSTGGTVQSGARRAKRMNEAQKARGCGGWRVLIDGRSKWRPLAFAVLRLPFIFSGEKKAVRYCLRRTAATVELLR